MLSTRIDDGYFHDKGFEAICHCALRILEALEPVHNNGYLHLDISPDNIHFSDLKIARLIDYNSAYHVSEPSEQLSFSIKEGYSANELMVRSSANTPVISRATDLFSVSAIIFEMLVHRRLGEDDWSMPSLWYLNNFSGYLDGASELLVRKTNAFLKKGISLASHGRFQSVQEMRSAIEELLHLKTTVDLIHSVRDFNSYFVCRDTEMKQIEQMLEQIT